MDYKVGERVYCFEKREWAVVMKAPHQNSIEIKFERPNVGWGDNRWSVSYKDIARKSELERKNKLIVGTPVFISKDATYKNLRGFILKNDYDGVSSGYIVGLFDKFERGSYGSWSRFGYPHTLCVSVLEKIEPRKASSMEQKFINLVIKTTTYNTPEETETPDMFELFMDDLTELYMGGVNDGI